MFEFKIVDSMYFYESIIAFLSFFLIGVLGYIIGKDYHKNLKWVIKFFRRKK